MDKREKQVVKALKSKPMSNKEYEQLKAEQEKMKKWVDDLKRNYPGVMCETLDGVTTYSWEDSTPAYDIKTTQIENCEPTNILGEAGKQLLKRFHIESDTLLKATGGDELHEAKPKGWDVLTKGDKE